MARSGNEGRARRGSHSTGIAVVLAVGRLQSRSMVV